jgi:hypothetical protein
MKTYAVTVPEIAIVAATRGVAGVGIGLLVADFLRPRHAANSRLDALNYRNFRKSGH